MWWYRLWVSPLLYEQCPCILYPFAWYPSQPVLLVITLGITLTIRTMSMHFVSFRRYPSQPVLLVITLSTSRSMGRGLARDPFQGTTSQVKAVSSSIEQMIVPIHPDTCKKCRSRVNKCTYAGNRLVFSCLLIHLNSLY